MGNSDQDREHVGTFADGERMLPHTAADHTPGHFSEGLERDHEALSRVAGNFAESDLQAHAEHERKGSFGDTDCPVCRAMAAAERVGS